MSIYPDVDNLVWTLNTLFRPTWTCMKLLHNRPLLMDFGLNVFLDISFHRET